LYRLFIKKLYICIVKLRNIIIIIFFIGGTTFSSGQNIALSFSSNNIFLPDTISMGDTIWYHCWIVNDGNSVITDQIALRAARLCQPQGLVDEREIGHINQGALFPGDSIELPLGMMYEVVHQQNYLTGDNIVVIWPRVQVSGSQVNEHLTNQIHVLNKSIISGKNDAIKIKENCFYFTNKTIHFLNEFSVSEVFLYNMLGNKVYKSNAPSLKEVNLQSITMGTYLMVIRLTDGTIRKEKLVVQ
jgi:hypothetical protein